VVLRAFCECFSLIALGGCAHMWEKEYIDEMNYPEIRQPWHHVRIKDSAQGALRRKVFNEKVETCQ